MTNKDLLRDRETYLETKKPIKDPYGEKVKINYPTQPCPECNGKGNRLGVECPICRGKGKI